MARITALFFGVHTRRKAHFVLAGWLAIASLLFGIPFILIAYEVIINQRSLLEPGELVLGLFFYSLPVVFVVYCYYVILSQYYATLKRLKRRDRRNQGASPWWISIGDDRW